MRPNACWQAGARWPSVMWFRRDLRLADNPALVAAAARRRRAPALRARPGPVGAGRAAAARLPRRRRCAPSTRLRSGGRLSVRARRPGPPGGRCAAQEVGADRVHVAADFGPYGRARDAAVEQALAEHGIELVRTGSPYAVAPGRVTNGDGEPYQVFTPFSRGLGRRTAGAARSTRRPGRAAGSSSTTPTEIPDAAVPDGLEPARGRRGGRAPALARVPGRAASPPTTTTATAPASTAPRRCRCTSSGARSTRARCSPTWLALRSDGAATYRNELAWREFYADVLFAPPETARDYLRPEFARMAYDEPGDAARRLAARAAPASRSSTPGCASCGRPAGCTTGSG